MRPDSRGAKAASKVFRTLFLFLPECIYNAKGFFVALILIVCGNGCSILQLQNEVFPEHYYTSVEFEQLGMIRTFIKDRFGPPNASLRDPRGRWIDVYVGRRSGFTSEGLTPRYEVAFAWFYNESNHVVSGIHSISWLQYQRIRGVASCGGRYKQDPDSAYQHCWSLMKDAANHSEAEERIPDHPFDWDTSKK